ncbi:hypothetical protein ACEWY4_012694 [Coilia grayii]|uniref:DUF5641 domain-containing protein n=1 Tax=Coilia grayii TaxID=363190 RepID=A0ABD1K1F0_9TELE
MEVEAILNSKPLGYVPSDIRDLDPMTPNCLLMGWPDGSDELLSQRRWQHVQVLADHFWARFSRLYLPGLQLRQKWQSSPADVTEDSVAMIVDPQLPRAMWPTVAHCEGHGWGTYGPQYVNGPRGHLIRPAI